MPAQEGLARKLLRLCDAYCTANGIARATLSRWMLNDSRRLEQLANGGSMTIRNYEASMAWLGENWPDDMPWPNDIERPGPPAKPVIRDRSAPKRLGRVAA